MASAGGSSRSHHVNVDSAPGDPIGENDHADPRYPLWRHVKKIQPNGRGGGNAKSECLFCEKCFPIQRILGKSSSSLQIFLFLEAILANVSQLRI